MDDIKSPWLPSRDAVDAWCRAHGAKLRGHLWRMPTYYFYFECNAAGQQRAVAAPYRK